MRATFWLGLMLLAAAPAAAQSSGAEAVALPRGYGGLAQNDLALRLRSDDLEIRFIPLDAEVTPLLAPDAYEALRGLVVSKRREIDSVAARAGVAQPGLALVTFFGQRPLARFDPQTVTVLVRNRAFQPLGIVPFSPRFTSQQLDVREQASAVYVFEEELPVDDSFTVTYGGLVSDDWRDKLPTLDRERARVSARRRGERLDRVR